MTDEDIPSRRVPLLRALGGARAVAMTRCLWSPPEQLAPSIEPCEAFSLGPGPFLLETDRDVVVGFASHPSRMSVTLWVERGSVNGMTGDCETLGATDLHPVDAMDGRFAPPAIANLVGQRITSVRFLKREMDDNACLPREVGVVLGFEGGGELIAAHGLHDDSDDFAVLRRDQLRPSIVPQLRELTLDALA